MDPQLGQVLQEGDGLVAARVHCVEAEIARQFEDGGFGAGIVARHQAEKFADRDAAIVAERQQAYAAQQPQQYVQQAPPPPPPPAPAAASQEDRIAQLERLAGLRDQGILSDEEFAAEKARILNG